MAGSEVPGPSGDTGVQRPLGERRRRRVAERTGQVDLDATMSQWPVAEPPTTPRPVVRPARPTVEGVATGPVLPTPGAMVVGPLLQARRAAAPGAPRDGSRRSRRTAPTAAAGRPVPSPAPTASTTARVLPAQGQRGGLPRTRRPGGRPLLLVAALAVLLLALLVLVLVVVLRPDDDVAQAAGPTPEVIEQTIDTGTAPGTPTSGETP